MIKEIEKIKNKDVDYSNLQDTVLSIQLSLDGFSFFIYNQLTDDFVAFASFKFENKDNSPYQHLKLVTQLFKQEKLLNLKYGNVQVIHCNNLVSQVPKPFFNKNKLTHYLQYTVKVLENDFITYDEISNSEIVTIYIPFVNINNFLLDKYGSFTYKHSATILIEKLLNLYKNLEGDFCFVNVIGNNFEIVVLKNKKLELYNNFTFTTKEDFIYYILFTSEQLNLNPEMFKLVFLGDIEKDSDLYKITYQYIRNVTFYKPLNPNAIFKHISSHSNFTLLNQL